MNRNERMVKTTVIYFIGNFASKLLTFFLLPLYTSWLTPTQFGKIDLILSMVPLIGPIFTLQITECIFRFLFECKNDDDKRNNITNAIFIYLLGIILFIIFYIPYCFFTQFEYPILFGVYFALMYMGTFVQQVMRGFSLNKTYASSGVISSFVQGIANIILIKFISEKSLLVAPILASSFVVFWGIIKTKLLKYIDFRKINMKTIKKQLSFSLPLIPNQICWWFTGISGKYIVNFFVGTVATGVLAVATKFPNLVSVVMQIYFLAWVENSIFEFESKDRDKYFSNNFNGLIEFIMFCIAGALLVIRIYFEYTIDVDYYEALIIIPILLGATMFNCTATFLGSIYTASQKTKDAFSTTMYAAVSNLTLAIILIPKIGLIGYAIANLISYFIFTLVRYKSINKICEIKLQFPKTSTVFSVILGIIIYYIGNVSICIVGILLIILLFVYKYKDIVLGVINKIIKK